MALPDLDDLSFLEAAATAQAILLTGNLRHFPKADALHFPVSHPSRPIWRHLTSNNRTADRLHGSDMLSLRHSSAQMLEPPRKPLGAGKPESRSRRCRSQASPQAIRYLGASPKGRGFSGCPFPAGSPPVPCNSLIPCGRDLVGSPRTRVDPLLHLYNCIKRAWHGEPLRVPGRANGQKEQAMDMHFWLGILLGLIAGGGAVWYFKVRALQTAVVTMTGEYQNAEKGRRELEAKSRLHPAPATS
jgi:hypothetical protein